MISNLDPSAQQFLNSLNRIGERMNAAQRAITSGRRVNQVSDDPDQVSTILMARAHLESAKQTQSNLGRVKGEVDTAEQSLQNAVQLFERAHTLATEGATSFATPASRLALSDEIGSILEQLTGITGTTVEGRFIFAGDSDQTAPYSIDLTQTNPLSVYLGSAATREVEHPNGTTFAVSHTAQEIFDSNDPTTNVFATLNAARNALAANDDAAIQTAVGAFSKTGGYLNSQLSFYGRVQNRVAEATEFGQTFQTQLQTQISGLEDADLTSAILELNQGLIQQQAALEARARIPRTTLFDFLA
jgi:flagellar hook-associated protein 3 FlgL